MHEEILDQLILNEENIRQGKDSLPSSESSHHSTKVTRANAE